MAEIKPVLNQKRRKRKRRRIFITVAIIIVLLILISLICGKKGNNVPVVTTDKVKTSDIVAKVNATGRVKPKAEVNIQAEIYEIIVDIPVEEGDSVDEGDLLVRLKQISYQFAVDQARADLRTARAGNEQARSNLDYWEFKNKQAKELFDRGHTSEEALITAKDQYVSARSSVETTAQSIKKAEIALSQALDYYEKTEILSPLNGVVTDLQYEVGERTMIASPNVPGAVIMTVADLSVLEVEVRVDETDIKDLRVGQEAEISVDAFPDTTFEGVVTNVGASAQVTGYTQSEQVTDFLVKVQFLENYEHIKPNLTAEVDIITGRAINAKNVPIQAVVGVEELPGEEKDSADMKDSSAASGRDKLYEGVYIYDHGVARFQQVELGIQDQTNIEIISGLEIDQVVITGPYNALRNLEDGDPVEERQTKNRTEE